jgi:hypothetical protein
MLIGSYKWWTNVNIDMRFCIVHISLLNSVGSLTSGKMATDLKAELSKKTVILDPKVWEVIGIAVGLFIIIILSVLSLCLTSRKKSRRTRNKIPLSQIPTVSKEIKEVRVEQVTTDEFVPRDGILLTIHDKSSDKESDKVLVHS